MCMLDFLDNQNMGSAQANEFISYCQFATSCPNASENLLKPSKGSHKKSATKKSTFQTCLENAYIFGT